MSSEFNYLREFDKFRLDPEKKVLWAGNEPVTLPLKEIEILCVLTRNGKEVVTKGELLDRIWGDSFVEESNLSQHIYRLRKTFKEFGAPADLIQTIPRRGYRFTGTVTVIENERVTVERHTRTQTLIEQIHSSDPGIHATLIPTASGSRMNAKRITATVVVVVLFGLLAAFTAERYTQTQSGSAIRSVAVMPFSSLNKAETETVHGLGIADALIYQLGRIGDLHVVSLNKVEGQSLKTDPAAIGREVGVDAVLDGTIQQDGSEVRISLRLIRARDGAQLWTTTIQESSGNIFKVQDSIALETFTALSRTIRPEQIRHLSESQEAYEAFLRGRYLLDRRVGNVYPSAKAEFERAIAIDPNFAAAFSGLADVFALQANIRGGSERDSLYNSSKAMALKALEIDPSSAHARTSLAWVKRVHEWNWAGAEEDFKKAIELDPNYATARQWYALLLTTLGRHDEALFQMEKARDLEPLSKSVILNYFAVRNYRGETDLLPSIVEQAERLEEKRPTNTRLIVASYFRRQDYRAVIEFGESVIAKDAGQIKSDFVAARMAISYFRIGDSKNAERFVEHLTKRAADSTEVAYHLSLVHSATGDHASAMDLLEKCFRARDDRMVWLNVEPEFADLRNDPRFRSLIEKMRLA